MDAVALETAFLDTWPDYREWLDEDRFREAMAPRLRSLSRSEKPFPHLFVEEFLPHPYYALMRDAWPPQEAFRANKTRKKLDLVLREDPGDEMTGRFSELPACIRDVWNFFVHVANRRVVGPWLAGLFAEEIRARLALLLPLYRAGKCGFTASGLDAGGFHQSNSGRLMMRGKGYVLLPHTDAAQFLVTALHYLAHGDDEEYGTTLYRAEREIPVEALVGDGTTTYLGEQGIAVTEVGRMPFRANGFLAFPNRLDAAHGLVGPRDGYRSVYQYHLSLKGDHEPL